MKQFDQDVLHWEDYDFVVINDDLEICYKEIINLIEQKLQKKDKSYDKKLIKEHIKKLIN